MVLRRWAWRGGVKNMGLVGGVGCGGGGCWILLWRDLAPMLGLGSWLRGRGRRARGRVIELGWWVDQLGIGLAVVVGGGFSAVRLGCGVY